MDRGGASRWTGSRRRRSAGSIRGAGPVDPRSVTSIGFLLAEKTPGPFALEVAWIKVLRGPGR
ncbi:MAG: CIA30 family protein [Comamonadaceae bacterium]|nr:CIA30 family protein [Comamonadaceae bacterium]